MSTRICIATAFFLISALVIAAPPEKSAQEVLIINQSDSPVPVTIDSGLTVEVTPSTEHTVLFEDYQPSVLSAVSTNGWVDQVVIPEGKTIRGFTLNTRIRNRETAAGYYGTCEVQIYKYDDTSGFSNLLIPAALYATPQSADHIQTHVNLPVPMVTGSNSTIQLKAYKAGDYIDCEAYLSIWVY
jgi:hypothetical protein